MIHYEIKFYFQKSEVVGDIVSFTTCIHAWEVVWAIADQLNVSNAGLNAALAIYSIDGKLVKQFRAETTDVSIDVSNWKKGFYIIKIRNENRYHTSKFVVK